MSSRGTLKTILLQLLGTSSDDPAYPAAVLNVALQQATDNLITEIRERNAQYFVADVTLSALSSTSHVYALAAQAPTFARILELRITDDAGAELEECPRIEQLRNAGPGFYAITGPDQSAKITTSPDSESGVALWMRYAYWPAEFTDDNSVPELPSRFHDVIPLEALLYVYGTGAEQRMGRELVELRNDRKALLMAHCTRRGRLGGRVRVEDDE